MAKLPLGVKETPFQSCSRQILLRMFLNYALRAWGIETYQSCRQLGMGYQRSRLGGNAVIASTRSAV